MLLCVNCGAAPPSHRRTWDRCVRCAELNLPSTYYCGQECMNAHWPKHRVYHNEQKRLAKQLSEGGQPERTRVVAEAEALARRAELAGDEYLKRTAAGLALNAKGDYHAAAKAWRKIIKEWPDRPTPYDNLGIVLHRASLYAEAAPMYLKAMELYEDGTKAWAESAAAAFDVLKHTACCEVPKPEWWNDKGLKALSAWVVAVAPDGIQPCSMRGFVLSCRYGLSAGLWNVEPRTAAEIKEAATWYRHAARESSKELFETWASQCDKIAGQLLTKEEIDAASARAAEEIEAEKARVAAEAKAKAAAEELLAEEEKEKQQAVSNTTGGKAKQGKGKKGKRQG